MHFDEYQRAALATAVYPDQGHNLAYPVLGLSGETGEVAEKIKKTLRDREGVLDEATRESLKKELGDVLWYLAVCCHEFGLLLDDVASTNLCKLADRRQRRVLHGSGDER